MIMRPGGDCYGRYYHWNERVIQLTRKYFEELFDAVVPGESVGRIVESLLCVHFDAFYHEIDVVTTTIPVEI